MKKRFHIYIIILILGFFFLPNLNYACGNKVQTECCKKELSVKAEKKSCCKKSNSKSSDKSCGGKCNSCNCTTVVVQMSINFVNTIEFPVATDEIYTKKSSFKYTNFTISSGYVSLWLIPKIS